MIAGTNDLNWIERFECYFNALIRHFFVHFHQKSCVFVTLISFFFNEVSSFRNRILTNQTPELVIRICKWIHCQSFSENIWLGTLIICPAKALCFWDENTFVKNFYTNCALAEFESNKCLTTFSKRNNITY